MAMPSPVIALRAPTFATGSSAGPSAPPPPLSFLTGSWYVTHSTLPMWKDKRNVRISYAPLPAGGLPPGPSSPSLDDLVEYEQPASSLPFLRCSNSDGWVAKTIAGVDSPLGAPAGGPAGGVGAGGDKPAAAWGYFWRGKGLLAFVTSRWELLGYGEEPAGEGAWVVTYFSKTLFTPAGIDIYSRRPQGLAADTLRALRAELGRSTDPGVRALVATMFEVPRV